MGSRGANSSIKERENKRMNVDKLMDDTAKINPNYSTGKKEYRVNCQACTLAFILREQGENVEALGRKGGYWKDGDGKMIQLNDMFSNNPSKLYYVVGQRRFDDEVLARNYLMRSGYSNLYSFKATEKSIFTNSADVIEDEVKKWGNGSSGYISVDWKNSSGGHVFNIKNVNGKVVSIDAQSNKVRDLKQTLSRAKPQYTFITRTDNLKVNQKLKKYMVKGA